MPVTPTTQIAPETTMGRPQEIRTASENQLGKDEFLRLLVGQLRHQDPMNPVNDTEFLGQMAQFTSVEQLTNLAGTLRSSQATSLIGKTVTYTGEDGQTATGTVERVTFQAGEPTLTINGVGGIDPASVTEVA